MGNEPLTPNRPYYWLKPSNQAVTGIAAPGRFFTCITCAAGMGVAGGVNALIVQAGRLAQ